MIHRFQKAALSNEFLLAMVCAMYRYEAHEVRTPKLLTDQEMEDFYFAYMGIAG
jgi:hypothetical protein